MEGVFAEEVPFYEDPKPYVGPGRESNKSVEISGCTGDTHSEHGTEEIGTVTE